MGYKVGMLDCPVLKLKIDISECIENQDCVDGIIKPHNLPKAFRSVDGYKQICDACPNNEANLEAE